jgi:hypothetical protein
VVTKHGIIGSGRGFLWVPLDQYKVLANDVPLEEELAILRDLIRKGEFETTSRRKVAMMTAFRLEYDTLEEAAPAVPPVAGGNGSRETVGRCRCKKGCSKKCKCVKTESGCGPTCGCQGMCSNKFNSLFEK